MGTSRRLVLWDIDHTLIESGGVGGEVFARAFREATGRGLGSDPDPAGQTERALFESAAAAAGVEVGPGVFGAFVLAQAEGYRARAAELRGRGRVLPGVVDVLGALRDQGVVQSVLTGNTRESGIVKLQAFGLTPFFDFEVASFGDCETDRAQLPLVAFARAELRYREAFGGGNTVMVGDTPADIAAARANGARVVAVATGRFGVADLADADVVLADLSDTEAVLVAVLG